VLVAILLLGAVLRFVHLGEQSLWLDELSELHTASRSFLSPFLEQVRANPSGTPFEYLGVRFFAFNFGHGTEQARVWAFLWGTSAVGFAYLAGRELLRDRTAGLSAALLTAVSPFLIYYSQEARPYSLEACATLVNLAAFGHALRRPGRRSWILYGLAAAVTVYAAPFLALLLLLEGALVVALWLWGRRIETRPAAAMVGGMAFGAVAFLPWAIYATRYQFGIGGYQIPAPLTLSRLHEVFVVLIGLAPISSAGSPSGVFPPNTLIQVAATDLLLLAAAVGVLVGLWRRRPEVLVPALTILAAIPLAWWTDQRGHYFWSERQVIFVLPCLYVLAGASAAAAIAGIPGRTRFGRLSTAAASLALVLVLLRLQLPSVLHVYQDQWIPKSDWRDAAAFVAAHAQPGAHFYSTWDSQIDYGIDYYQPGLAAGSAWLYSASGQVQSDLVVAIGAAPLGPSDWVVGDTNVLSGAPEQALAARGLSCRDFGGITDCWTPAT
jgi:4-amino-4-deoxy-L-arabinose transferase-like glycosyltransferase